MMVKPNAGAENQSMLFTPVHEKDHGGRRCTEERNALINTAKSVGARHGLAANMKFASTRPERTDTTHHLVAKRARTRRQHGRRVRPLRTGRARSGCRRGSSISHQR